MTKQQLPDDLKHEAAQIIPIQGQETGTWQDQLRRNGSGGIQTRSVLNIELLIEHDPELTGRIGFDEFAGLIRVNQDIPKLGAHIGYWTDTHDAALRGYLERSHGLLFGKDNITDGVMNVAHAHAVNPVKRHIETRAWDGEERAANYFIDYLGAEANDYTRAVTKVWLTGAVARVYDPGCKFELVPILEGKQGAGKSTAARNLFAPYFNDTLQGLGRDKDDYQALAGSWIIEIAELASMKKTDTDKMKNFISAQSDTYRGAYGRYSYPHPRQCVFIGSTNQRGYLKDDTGERRFYPIKCGVQQSRLNVWRPDPEYLYQVLAEAKHWYDSGAPLFLDHSMMQLAKEYQEGAAVTDPVRDALQDFTTMKVPANWANLDEDLKHAYYRDYHAIGGTVDSLPDYLRLKLDLSSMHQVTRTTTNELMAVVFDRTPDKYFAGRANSEAKHISSIMTGLREWEPHRLYINGSRRNGWIRKDDDDEKE